jgi:hypothetical protein
MRLRYPLRQDAHRRSLEPMPRETIFKGDLMFVPFEDGPDGMAAQVPERGEVVGVESDDTGLWVVLERRKPPLWFWAYTPVVQPSL